MTKIAEPTHPIETPNDTLTVMPNSWAFIDTAADSLPITPQDHRVYLRLACLESTGETSWPRTALYSIPLMSSQAIIASLKVLKAVNMAHVTIEGKQITDITLTDSHRWGKGEKTDE